MELLDEDTLIARYFAPIAGPAGLRLLDDAAVLTPPAGMDLVVTADALVAGIHFFADDPAGSIARKALAVNLSDLAAKGAEPLGFVLTLALQAGRTADWLGGFAAGLAEEAASAACPLLGGDTVRTPGPLTLSITAFGTVPHGRMVRRTGAAAGDRLYVTGTIGDAALGLRLRCGDIPNLGQGERDHLLDRFLHPRARLALRAALLAHAHGAMDVSDGFVGDLAKMMRASGATAEVDLSAVPLSPAARATIAAAPELFDVAVTGGDDYEILAAVPLAEVAAFERAAMAAGVAAAPIGAVLPGTAPPRFRAADGTARSFGRGSFSHF
ncbi:MAG TPA: thiamine-phosphate kinase [Lichenihabitans sp.]|nr:thiamine-phosphate kinase [Lichenihabitans sp.]